MASKTEASESPQTKHQYSQASVSHTVVQSVDLKCGVQFQEARVYDKDSISSETCRSRAPAKQLFKERTRGEEGVRC